MAVRRGARVLGKVLSANPISRILINSYTFWYWLPKRNMPYDMPWQLFRNSTVEWLAWYQIPHNLPPYRFLPIEALDGPFGGYRDDFFCYGLPGNTLPLGNWDPAGFQLVDKRVVYKYRESELKHGRLAMLSCLGFSTAEAFHPLHPDLGGLAITHMAQLAQLDPSEGMLGGLLAQFGVDPAGVMHLPFDYAFIVLLMASFEVFALKRNWTRNDEYRHQFDHSIGIGNLKEGYENGNYGFDLLRLRPSDPQLRRDVEEMELNHGRLACVAIIGMIGQEYLTGLPILTSLSLWLGQPTATASTSTSFDVSSLAKTLSDFVRSLSTEGLGLGAPSLPTL